MNHHRTTHHRTPTIMAVILLILTIVVTSTSCDLLFPKYYTVLFNSNSGSFVAPAEKVKEGALVPEPVNPTRTGYTFEDWYSDQACTVCWNFQTERLLDDIMLYAKWTADSHKLSFDANDGTGTMGDVDLDTDEQTTLPANTFTRTGYTFAGWATTSTGNSAYADEASYTMGTANQTLYALWTIDSHTLSFDANGGTGTMDDVDLDYNEQTTLPTNTFTRTGYTFAGWATTSTGSSAYANEASYTMGTENKTLYALWTADSYKLSFDANGGSGSMSDVDLEPNEQTTLPANTFTNSDTYLLFKGWATTSAGSVEYDDEESYTMGSADQTLYAIWGTYELGDTGPAGGIIFYDDDSSDLLPNNHRFLEVAPYGWYNDGADPGIKWGGYGIAVTTSEFVGQGSSATATIISTLTGESGAFAAKACADYSVDNNGDTYDDWFLPSREELLELLQHLTPSMNLSGNYWSSTNYPGFSDQYSYTRNASNQAALSGSNRNSTYNVRPVRSF